MTVADDGRCEMEFLHRIQQSSDLKWKNPPKTDSDFLTKNSIISCAIDGEWDVSKDRNMTFTLRNHEYINHLVKDMI